MKNNQFGRSMLEMLGVLAIIGVLSVGGIAGYSKAMEMWKISRQKQQTAEIFMQIITLKDDFLNVYYKTGASVPTAGIMEAMGVIPDGMKKVDDDVLEDSEGNRIQVYMASWNGTLSGLEYYLILQALAAGKSNRQLENYCVTVLEQAKAVSSYILYMTKRDYKGNSFSSTFLDVSTMTPSDIHGFCKTCNSESACGLLLKFKL